MIASIVSQPSHLSLNHDTFVESVLLLEFRMDACLFWVDVEVLVFGAFDAQFLLAFFDDGPSA